MGNAVAGMAEWACFMFVVSAVGGSAIGLLVGMILGGKKIKTLTMIAGAVGNPVGIWIAWSSLAATSPPPLPGIWSISWLLAGGIIGASILSMAVVFIYKQKSRK